MAPLWHVWGLALLCHGVIAGQLGGRTAVEDAPRRQLRGRFLHITDIHPDEFYKVHSSTDEEDGCHRGTGPAGPYGAETTDCDSPFSLVNATFDWIEAHLKDEIDFVVWTGDSARHDRDEGLPRNEDQVLRTNRMIADRFAQLFSDAEGRGLSIPIIPTLGNNDILPHNIMMPGPNRWLQHYTHIWRHFVPEEQRHSFEFGGWFHVEVVPNKLAVFSLNTLYFFDRNAGVDGCAAPSEPGFHQLEWLRVQLQFMRERGMKVILMGHVPPARTDSKRLWDETCWEKYTLWMHQFRDVVVAGLYGHMNIDHFLIHDSAELDLPFLLGDSPQRVNARVAMEDELTIVSATDYLQELRDGWSKLTPPPSADEKNGKGKKGDQVSGDGRRGRGRKHKKDKWNERYILSLVGPSVVPTFFPTLRVLEYNITGLEEAPTWKDTPKTMPVAPSDPSHPSDPSPGTQKHMELRHAPDEIEAEAEWEADAMGNKRKKKKPKKDKKPHDPNLVIPAPPSKTSPPGPAYSPQTLSLTGWTQYFANLTHINNLTLEVRPTTDEGATLAEYVDSYVTWMQDWLLKWRKGKHGGKKPTKPKPEPREFGYEVEYSTFTDKSYKLEDLTVSSMVELAYRMGQKAGGKDLVGVEEQHGCGHDEDVADVEEAGTDTEDDGSDDDEELLEAEKKKGRKGDKKKKKKKKKKHSKKKNKAWLHFLNHAFVGTLDEEQLSGMA